jgi:ribulose-phosphate 3-epimerase
MDGRFVPNLTFGPPVVAALRPHTGRYLDCHLMVEDPEALLPALAEAGASGVSMHVEALDDPARALAAAAGHGLDAGLALKPGRPVALQVDGGVNAATLPGCLEAGADVFVVGTAIFGADDPAAAAKAFRELIDGGDD